MGDDYITGDKEKEFVDNLGKHREVYTTQKSYKQRLIEYINSCQDSLEPHLIIGVAHARMRLAEEEKGQ